jgi:hypothetical protein
MAGICNNIMDAVNITDNMFVTIALVLATADNQARPIAPIEHTSLLRLFLHLLQ